ncbi:NAD(P)H-hydrate epimerase [Haloferula luteola]|uniref:ADP-dependent (S)-NAD(P)H-hydrate dehydratase n=1 Tax=Haloferula luteola TaxID=595692 RepID=A0A840VBX5_9BACT|nr:NAD(P)H-hydrate dehydratase [Haloferula luteola]MBB5350381.1 NAD(P)H-hydrate epimerase [Haloferula luteola]
MAWVTAQEMRALEARAFSSGVDPGALMDRAGIGIARHLLAHFPTPGHAVAYLGKGNNAGDAIVVLEQLFAHGWSIDFRASHPQEAWSELTQQRFQRLHSALSNPCPSASRPGPLLLLDGLLGIGAHGEIREPLLSLSREMQHLRETDGAIVAAIDLPSGLDSDQGIPSKGAVIADLTLTVGVPKKGLHADSANDSVGRLFLVPLSELRPPADRHPIWSFPSTHPCRLPPRPHSFHKGDAGRVAVLAGSVHFSGAATLCATGALRGGAGLVTLFLDPDNPAQPPPEIMTRRIGSRIEAAFSARADARVLGPGLGELTPPQAQTLLRHLSDDSVPLVLDADALNLIAATTSLDLLAPHHLITPHPGEFARLAPDLAQLPRLEAARRFTQRHPCHLLLKGTRTLICQPGGELHINPTGHAGMATGGQGDVLAGVCGALAAAGHSLADAAILAAWLCGRAAERAITYGSESEQSCSASDTLHHLGGAFLDWKQVRR